MGNYKEKLEVINKRLETEKDLSKRVLLVMAKIDIENKLEKGDF